MNGSCTRWSDKEFAVTFSWDDGNDPQVTYVPSLMESLHISGTFYITPFFLDPIHDQPTPDQLENKWNWVRESYATHEVGAHTLDHLDMSNPRLDDDRIVYQFNRSNEILHRHTNRTIRSFAWPFGRYSANSLALSLSYYASVRSTKCAINTWNNDGAPLLHSCEMSNDVSANVRNAMRAKSQGAWLIFHGHGVDSCAPVGSDWVDVTLPVNESRHQNRGLSKADERAVSAIKNMRTGKVYECRYGWNPLKKRVVEETMDIILRLRPWVDTVGRIFEHRRACQGSRGGEVHGHT
jgi:peptidoglycan/xylan/chitin deacetylase (PgdA/CDA1 family)